MANGMFGRDLENKQADLENAVKASHGYRDRSSHFLIMPRHEDQQICSVSLAVWKGEEIGIRVAATCMNLITQTLTVQVELPGSELGLLSLE